jgi:hypothetical protein
MALEAAEEVDEEAVRNCDEEEATDERRDIDRDDEEEEEDEEDKDEDNKGRKEEEEDEENGCSSGTAGRSRKHWMWEYSSHEVTGWNTDKEDDEDEEELGVIVERGVEEIGTEADEPVWTRGIFKGLSNPMFLYVSRLILAGAIKEEDEEEEVEATEEEDEEEEVGEIEE